MVLPAKRPFMTFGSLAQSYAELKSRFSRLAPEYGKYPWLGDVVADYKAVREWVGYSLSEWIHKYEPGAWDALNRFHRSWFMSEKIDYLCGKISVQTRKIHPSLNGLLSAAAATFILPKHKIERLATTALSSWLEDSLYATNLSQLVYSW